MKGKMELESRMTRGVLPIEAQTAATACTALVRNIPKKGVDDTAQLGAQMQAHLQQLYGARSVVSCVAVPRVRPLYLLQQRCELVAERALFLQQQQHHQGGDINGAGGTPQRPSRWARWKLARVNKELQQLRDEAVDYSKHFKHQNARDAARGRWDEQRSRLGTPRTSWMGGTLSAGRT